ncbi:MAG: transglutaminase family protein [Planctomycetota bacterium]
MTKVMTMAGQSFPKVFRLVPVGVLACAAFCLPSQRSIADELSPPDPATTASRPNLSFEELARQVRPSLVLVRCQDRTGAEFGQGAGFVVGANGLIATARHTIGDGRDITVEFPDGTVKPVVEVYASTHSADICVIRVDIEGLAALPVSKADETAQGSEVAALGHPRGDRNVMATGIVSGHQEIDGVRAVRLAMPIQPGNSGGPVVDRSGEVVGIVTLKSVVEDNVGYAVPGNLLRELLDHPNPIPMERWRTIGSLDPRQWKTVFGANWRQRAGRITVDGQSSSFGGRTLCLSQMELPKAPFDLSVLVRLDDERGAAGLVFHSDGLDQHYGFYPSAGNIRLTRFSGPDVNSWTVLFDEPVEAYRPGEWNLLLIRFLEGRFECYVNGRKVAESTDNQLATGHAGLASFRGTKAEFRRFDAGPDLLPKTPANEQTAVLQQAISAVQPGRPASPAIIESLLPLDSHVSEFMEREAKELEQKARMLRTLSADVAAEKTRRELAQELNLILTNPATPNDLSNATDTDAGPGRTIDLLRAALLLAKIDNPDIHVEAYLRRVDIMADDVRAMLSSTSADTERIARLDQYLFQELGLRGSRFEYDNRSNSFLNEVIDDREGLPITLSVLYMELARRLDLTVVGVGLPGHFVVRFEPRDPSQPRETIDVFARGQRLSDAQISLLMSEAGFPDEQRFRAAKTPLEIIERMAANLLRRAESERVDEDVLRYLETLVMLSPTNLEYRIKRLEMRSRTGRLQLAIDDANWLIVEAPPGLNIEMIRELKQAAEEKLDPDSRQ